MRGQAIGERVCEPLALQGTGCAFRLVVWVHRSQVSPLCFCPGQALPRQGAFTYWGGGAWSPQGKALLCSGPGPRDSPFWG